MTYPEPNQYGVWLPEQCEVFTLPAKGAYKIPAASVLVVQTDEGCWRWSVEFKTRKGSAALSGGYPSKVSRPMPTREMAIQAGCYELIRLMDGLDCRMAKEQAAEAQKIRAWAESLGDLIEAGEPEQLELVLA